MSTIKFLIQQYDLQKERENKMNSIVTQANASNKVKSGYFMVGSQLKLEGTVSFAPNAALHVSLNQAKAEAARLANLHKEKRFVVVEVKGVVEVQDTIWS